MTTKFTPPLWENVRLALRDGLQQKLAALEKQIASQQLDDDLRTAIEAEIIWAKGDTEGAKTKLISGKPGPYCKLILGHLAIDAGDAAQAAQMFDQAEKGGVNDPRLLAGKGAVSLIRGNAKDAAKHLKAAVDRDEKDWHARYVYGLALAETGDRSGALDAFTRVTKERPQFDPGWLGFASTSVALGRGKDAAQAIAKHARKNADSAQLQFAYADCLLAAGELQQAVGVLTPFASKSKDVSFLLDYAELCLAAGLLPNAETTLEVVGALDDKSARAAIIRGHVAEMSQPRRLEDAVTEYKKSIALQPKNARAKISLGLLLMRDTAVKDWAEAGKALEGALKDESPAPIAALLNLAVLRISEGKKDEAKKYASQVLARKVADPRVNEQAERIIAQAAS